MPPSPQQINLYSPALRPPRRHFTALAMAQGLGLVGAGMAALALWSAMATARLQSDHLATAQALAHEQARMAALAGSRPAALTNTAALEQQLRDEAASLAGRRELLARLTGPSGGVADAPGLLRLLAQTAPASLWLEEIRQGEGRVELAGVCMDLDALQAWVGRLSAAPQWVGGPLRTLQLERRVDREADPRGTFGFRLASRPAAVEPRGRAGGSP